MLFMTVERKLEGILMQKFVHLDDLKYYENLINWLDVNTLKIEEIILY
jgi:hypothetical protein